jgi:glycosyltransferase involved in cell wall biosynthesis
MEQIASKDKHLMVPNTVDNSTALHIILEGKIFEEQPFGGISRTYQEILPRMCAMDEQILFSILTSGRLMQSLPQHARIAGYSSKYSIHRFLRPQIIFWQLQDYLRSELQFASFHPDKNTIWHATYFQLPHSWKGPIVTSVYDLIPEKYLRFFNKGYDHIFRARRKRAVLAADKVLCNSETTRSDVVEIYGLPQERAVAVPLACGDSFREITKEDIALNFRVDQPFILYVGMRAHYKNFQTLLNAYATWPRRNEINLLVVGSAWSTEEQKAITAAGLGPNIACRSGVTDEELCALYNQALAFVYPSLSEGFGIPLLEGLWMSNCCLPDSGIYGSSRGCSLFF